MKYPCMTFSQRNDGNAPKFCIFHAPVSEILAWAEIPRLSHKDKNGIQRAKNDYKVRGIKKFLSADDRNTIPTAVVITLSDGAYNIVKDKKSPEQIEIVQGMQGGAFVVDGQHRLYGINEFDPKAKVPVVAILGATDEERAFQFIVINNKVSKVNADHIRALALNFTNPQKELGLEARLNSARLSLNKNLGYVGQANTSEESPFMGIIALPDTPKNDQIVVPASIEAAVAYIQSKNMLQISSDDGPYELFTTIWSTIKSEWPDTFEKDSKLLSKVGIQCMTQYITDNIDVISSFIEVDIDLSNAEDVSNSVRKILQLQTETFWLVPWSINISDTKLVRDQISEALRRIQQNLKQRHPWNTEVQILRNG
ncbi:MAG: DGQHR domain-containing protein [Pseudomonadaceae bacterium]